MSAFMPPPPPGPTTPPALTVPVAYGVGGAPEGAAGSGSYGPVIAMLAVVVVLAAAALAVGRLCFGRRAPGQAAGHDLEAWVERTCGPCVGAAMLTPAKEEESGGGGGTGAPAVAAAAATEAEPPPPPPEGTERGDGISIAS